MCELFAISASAPLQVRYDLNAFAAEGGERHLNRDGWGIVIHEGRDAHYFREAAPAADSPLDRFVQTHTRPHATVMAHVRRASSGDRSLANTHPFRRIQNGQLHHFAHNGALESLAQTDEAQRLLAHRIGETDSELAFLLLLDRLARGAPDPRDIAARFKLFHEFGQDIAGFGTANLLWLDGETLFVHADQRQHETPAGLTPPEPPGLHMLHPETATLGREHHCASARLSDIPDNITLFASVPLSDARWEPLGRGTSLAVAKGKILFRQPAGGGLAQ